jgi:hypothetical protein
VAAVISRILNSGRPRRRVSVAKVDERVGIIAKRLLPYRVFERGRGGAWASDRRPATGEEAGDPGGL